MVKKILSAICIMFILPNAGNAQLTSGLVAHWTFSGNVNDVSGNGHHGNANNITYGSGKLGVANSSAVFNGTSSYISIPYKSDLNVDSFTICAMVKVNDYYPGACQANAIFWRGAQFQNGFYSLFFMDNPFTNSCQLRDTSKNVFTSEVNQTIVSSSGIPWQYTPTIVSNRWYCVVTVYDKNTSKIYVDGQLKSTFTALQGTMGVSNLGASIGASRFGSFSSFPYWLNGEIDDLRLYNRALSPSEVGQYCGMFDTTVYISQAFNDTLFCQDDTVQLQYGVTKNFRSGNVFTAQLSDATGSFSAPTNIGSVSSATAGSISCNIPGGLTPSSAYRVRVVSSLPQRTSDVSSTITVHPTLGPPIVNTTVAPVGVVPSNTTLTFTANVTNAGSNPTYQWYRNGQAITNATSATWSSNTLNDNDSVWVVVYSSNMCPADLNSESNKIQVKIESSVRDLILENFALYPNPNEGSFAISATSVNFKDVKLSIINTIGQVVYQKVLQSENNQLKESIDMGHVAAGVYTMIISKGDKQRIVRFSIK